MLHRITHLFFFLVFAKAHQILTIESKVTTDQMCQFFCCCATLKMYKSFTNTSINFERLPRNMHSIHKARSKQQAIRNTIYFFITCRNVFDAFFITHKWCLMQSIRPFILSIIHVCMNGCWQIYIHEHWAWGPSLETRVISTTITNIILSLLPHMIDILLWKYNNRNA